VAELPPDLAALAAQRRLDTQTIGVRAWILVRGAWRRIDQDHVTESWDSLAPSVGRLMRGAQIAAATGAQEYVTRALTMQGADPEAEGSVPPVAYSGTASDGRPLDSLLSIPAQTTEDAIREGVAPDLAMVQGEIQLRRMVSTQITDAGRVPVGVATAAVRQHNMGYIRMLTPPSCARCIIMAGKWYRFNEGFKRHPLCDCVHVPIAEALSEDYVTNPMLYFEQMDKAEQDGADLSQVVNVRKEMRSVQMAGRSLRATGVGTTRRGLGGQRLSRGGRRNKVVRLMPESIYEIAGSDRDELIRLLKLHGYIV
jgi:hypothetical protein